MILYYIVTKQEVEIDSIREYGVGIREIGCRIERFDVGIGNYLRLR